MQLEVLSVWILDFWASSISFFTETLFNYSFVFITTNCLGLYFVAVERQTQNRARMLAEELRAASSGGNNGEDS